MYSLICADDDAYIREIYRGILRQRGYKVRLCSNGIEALKSFRKKPVDMLILDVDMPEKNGIEVCRELRQAADGYDVPIIIVSGRDGEEDIVRGLAAGADDYIVKSFRPAELLAKISAILRKRESKSANSGITIGSVFAGRYKLLDKIGEGGFGSVYLANDVHEQAEQKVSLKIFESALGDGNNDRFLSYFLREAYGLSKLDHPNIVKLINFGHDNLLYYLVMEFVEGQNLMEVVERQGRLSNGATISIAYQMAQALCYMDGEKLIHRDVTPRNIILDFNGQVKLVDFGLAKNIQDSSITTSTEFKGTPHFISPECIAGSRAMDMQSDIFSLAATLYMVATGNLPFEGRDLKEIGKKQLFEELPSISSLVADVDPAFSDLIDAMLAKRPEHRPPIGKVVATLTGLNKKCNVQGRSLKKLLLPRFF